MPDRSSRFWARALAGSGSFLAVASFLFAVWHFRSYLIDDTFISLRYARNLADGHGLVFNPGEYVEGYTNLSFVLLSALCYRLGVDPVSALRLLSLASALVVVRCVQRLESAGPKAATMAPYLLVAGPAFAYWSVAVFETMLFVGLFTTALLQIWREGQRDAGHRSSLVWIALALTRPEGLYLFTVTSAAFAISDYISRRQLATTIRRHATNGLIVAGAIAPHFLWRYWYYGSWAPNTYYAKVTGGYEQLWTGIRGLGQWAAAYPFHALASLCLAAVLTPIGRRMVREHPYTLAIALIAAADTAYVTLIGGDFMPYFRFFQHVVPLSCLLLSWTIATIARHGAEPTSVSLRTSATAAVVIAITIATSLASTQRVSAFVSHRTTTNGIRVGKALAARSPPDTLIAVNTAGVVPFFSGLPSIDMLGLTDAAIARRPTYIVSTGWAGHRKGWGDYVLRRRPEIIMWYNTAGAREPFYLGDHELADSALFRLQYDLRSQALDPVQTPDQPLTYFFGAPFDSSSSRSTISPELGFRAEVDGQIIPYTTVVETPLIVHTFERDRKLIKVADELAANSQRPQRLIDIALRTWREPLRPTDGDPVLRARVDALCDEARRAAESEKIPLAKKLLAQASQLNRTLQSAVVFQYIANVAILSHDPFIAIGAQKEALRIEPDNTLYRHNLTALLTKPYKSFVAKPDENEP